MSGKSIILLDTTDTSLTVSWPDIPKAIRYELQYRRFSSCSDDDNNEKNNKYETLSNRLTSTQARKRNLHDINGIGFQFRVRPIFDIDDNEKEQNENKEKKQNEDVNTTENLWISHDDPLYLLDTAKEKNRMSNAPRCFLDGNYAAIITWDFHKQSEEEEGFEIQMRENRGGDPWRTIAPCFRERQVRKKNLTLEAGYQFRIRPILRAAEGNNDNNDDNTETLPPPYFFSPPSDIVRAHGLSNGIRQFFFSELDGPLWKRTTSKQQNNNNPFQSVSLDDALGGREFILLYASAHWCGPCRQFTPRLIQFYNTAKQQQSDANFEIVFLSADHDQSSFQSYFGSMPWMAVPFDSDAREDIMAKIRVSGIPRLVVIDGRTGRILEDNAVGKPLDLAHWRQLARK